MCSQELTKPGEALDIFELGRGVHLHQLLIERGCLDAAFHLLLELGRKIAYVGGKRRVFLANAFCLRLDLMQLLLGLRGRSGQGRDLSEGP